MKTSYASAIVLTVSALASSYAMAGGRGGVYQFPETDATVASAPATKTRAEVAAELAEAQRTGDIAVHVGSQIKRLNELYPGQYPAKPAVQGKTRAQVLAELADAQRDSESFSRLGTNLTAQ